MDRDAVADLFVQYAQERNGILTLDWKDVACLLKGIGEDPRDETVRMLFKVADEDGNGVIDVDEFFENAGVFLGDSPARMIIVVGGPGSGKGLLSERLQRECNVIHLSSGNLLRSEVEEGTALGMQVKEIIRRGELVSSAIMVALMKKRMREHPGKRILLDGFPRSPENAHDLVTICGKPEMALHLVCDDTILMERIMNRGAAANAAGETARSDDNFHTALERIRTYHRYHDKTLEWLREQHVPIVNLDCEGTPDQVWSQLVTIGKLMRPVVKTTTDLIKPKESPQELDWSSDPGRTSSLPF
jgi:adenylate kinase family enzyme